jgi:ribose transport system substrate-binding protein
MSLFTRWLLFLGLFAVLGCGGNNSGRPAAGGQGKYRIAVIPKGLTHDFWRSIHAGAVHAATQRGDAEILWDGPAKEDERTKQQQIVERFTGERVDAIVLAPCDRQTLVAPVEAAIKRGIPVVIIDSGLEISEAASQSEKYLGYVATDNRQGGARGAQRMIELLKDATQFKDSAKVKVLMLRYQAGSESTEQREAGFRETIKTAAHIQLDEAPDEAGATADSAQRVAERLLAGKQDYDGVFAPNESSATGTLQALRVLKLAGKIKMVGFDSSPILLEGLRAGDLHGLVVQDPFDMGYQSVTRALDYLQKNLAPKDKLKHTNLQVVTKENMDRPDIKALFGRDLRQYLGD